LRRWFTKKSPVLLFSFFTVVLVLIIGLQFVPAGQIVHSFMPRHIMTNTAHPPITTISYTPVKSGTTNWVRSTTPFALTGTNGSAAYAIVSSFIPEETFTEYAENHVIINENGWNNWVSDAKYTFTAVTQSSSMRAFLSKTVATGPTNYPKYTFSLAQTAGIGSVSFTLTPNVLPTVSELVMMRPAGGAFCTGFYWSSDGSVYALSTAAWVDTTLNLAAGTAYSITLTYTSTTTYTLTINSVMYGPYGTYASNANPILTIDFGSYDNSDIGSFYIDNIDASWISTFPKAAWQAYSTPFNVNGQPNGTVYIGYNSTVSSLVETTHVLPVYLDTIAPTTTLSFTPSYTNGKGEKWITSSTTFTLKPTDNAGGCGLHNFTVPTENFDSWTIGASLNGPSPSGWCSWTTVDPSSIVAGMNTYAGSLTLVSYVGQSCMTLNSPKTSITAGNYIQVDLKPSSVTTYSSYCFMHSSGNGNAGVLFVNGNIQDMSSTATLTTYAANSIYRVQIIIVSSSLFDIRVNGTLYTNGGSHFPMATATMTDITNLYITGSSTSGLETMTFDNIYNSWSNATQVYYKIRGSMTMSWQFIIAGSSFTFPSSVNGSYCITYSSIDAAGNNETLNTQWVYIDTLNPTTSVSYSPAYGANYVTASTTFTLSAVDDSGVASTHYRYAGATYTYSIPFSISGSDGSITIYYWSTDNMGNNASASSITVILDATPPSSTTITPSPALSSSWSGSTNTFTFTSSDGSGSGIGLIHARVAGVTFIYKLPFTLSNLSLTTNTQYTLYAWTTDKCGNNQTVASSLIIKYDMTEPDTGLSFTPNYIGWGVFVTTATSFTLLPDDTGGSGVAATYYQINSQGWIAGTSFSLTGQPNGTYIVEYFSVDNVGNMEVVNSHSVQLDTLATTTALSYSPAATTNGRNFVNTTTLFTLSAVDDSTKSSGVQYTKYRIGGTTYAYSSPFTLPAGLTNGTWALYYWSMDNNGNNASASSTSLNFDKNPPISTTITPSMIIPAPIEDFDSFSDGDTISASQWTVAGTSVSSYFKAKSVSGGIVGHFYDHDYTQTLWAKYTFGISQISISTLSCTIRVNQLPTTSVYWETGNGLGLLARLEIMDTNHLQARVSGSSWIDICTLSLSANYIITIVDFSDQKFDVTVNGSIYTNGGAHYSHYGGTIGWATYTQFGTGSTNDIADIYIDDITASWAVSWASMSTVFTLTSSDAGAKESGIASRRYRIDGMTYAYSSPFTLPIGLIDGNTYMLNSWSIDSCGNNQSSANNLFVKIDKSAPVTGISFSWNYGGQFVTTTTSFTLTPVDTESGASLSIYEIDGEGWNVYTTPFTLDALNGTRIISFASTDNVGNLETTKTQVVFLDIIAPTTSISYNYYYGTFITQSTSITISGVDDDVKASGIASTHYRYSGTTYLYSGPFTLTSNGTHVLSAWSTDNNGNNGTATTVTLKIDANAPASTTITVSPALFGFGYVSVYNTFSLSSTDGSGESGIASMYYRVNGVTHGFTTDFDLSALGNGTYTINAWAIDNVGNNQSVPSTLIVYLDENAPTSSLSYSILSAPDFVNASSTFQLTAVDGGTGESGVAGTIYQVDSSGWITYVGAFNLGAYVDGAHVIYYASYDNVGNLEATQSVTVTLDATPPATTNSYSTAWILGSMLLQTTFTIIPTDARSGVAQTFYSLNSGTWTLYTVPFVFTNTYPDNDTIEYYSVDNCGNVESTITYNYLVNYGAVKAVNIGFYSLVDGDTIPFSDPIVIVNGLTLSSSSFTMNGVNFHLVVIYPLTGTILFNQWLAWNGNGSYLIGLDVTGTCYFQYWATGSVGLGSFVAKMFVNGTRLPPVGSASFLPAVSNVTIQDFANFTIYTKTVSWAVNGRFIDIFLPICDVYFTNDFNYSVTILITHGHETIHASVPALSPYHIMLSTATYNYTVLLPNNKVARSENGTAYSSLNAPVDSNDPATWSYSFGWHNVTVPPDPNLARQNSFIIEMVITIFSVVGIFMVIAIIVASRKKQQKRRALVSRGSSAPVVRARQWQPEFISEN
jgi:hypothetical protein